MTTDSYTLLRLRKSDVSSVLLESNTRSIRRLAPDEFDRGQDVEVVGAPDSPSPNAVRHLLRKPSVRLV
jgi:hypothetical protein